MPANAHELADWHFRAGAIDRLLPPWEDVEILERPGAMADGAVARFRMKKFGIGIEWVARHHDVEPGRGFTDTQERGPFSSWVHRHSFLPEGDRSSMLEDRIQYELPGGILDVQRGRFGVVESCRGGGWVGLRSREVVFACPLEGIVGRVVNHCCQKLYFSRRLRKASSVPSMMSRTALVTDAWSSPPQASASPLPSRASKA
jgi:ligand-binding SRPBCC domain-containing protein